MILDSTLEALSVKTDANAQIINLCDIIVADAALLRAVVDLLSFSVILARHSFLNS